MDNKNLRNNPENRKNRALFLKILSETQKNENVEWENTYKFL